MRSLLLSEILAVSGGVEDNHKPIEPVDCDDFPWTCFMHDVAGATEQIANIIENVWNGIYTLVDIVSCNLVPAELTDAITDWLGIHNPCGSEGS